MQGKCFQGMSQMISNICRVRSIVQALWHLYIPARDKNHGGNSTAAILIAFG
jgi:hypothetical protein